MLVNAKEMLQKAREGKYAIGAFNVENMEMVMAVLAAAEALLCQCGCCCQEKLRACSNAFGPR